MRNHLCVGFVPIGLIFIVLCLCDLESGGGYFLCEVEEVIRRLDPKEEEEE